MENIETLCIMVYNVINKMNFLHQLENIILKMGDGVLVYLLPISIITLILYGMGIGIMFLSIYCLILAIKALKIYISKNE